MRATTTFFAVVASYELVCKVCEPDGFKGYDSRRANRLAHVFPFAAFANYERGALADRENQNVSKSVERQP